MGTVSSLLTATNIRQKEMFAVLLLPVACLEKHQKKKKKNVSNAASCTGLSEPSTDCIDCRRSNSPKIKGLLTISELSI